MMWDVDVGLMELKGKFTTNTIGTPFLLRPSRFLAASSARRRPSLMLHAMVPAQMQEKTSQATSLIHRQTEVNLQSQSTASRSQTLAQT